MYLVKSEQRIEQHIQLNTKTDWCAMVRSWNDTRRLQTSAISELKVNNDMRLIVICKWKISGKAEGGGAWRAPPNEYLSVPLGDGVKYIAIY